MHYNHSYSARALQLYETANCVAGGDGRGYELVAIDLVAAGP